jgi:hypothetical protein
VRRRWVWNPKLKKLVEINLNARTEQAAPAVVGDLPGYVSPVTGLWIEGRKARREDLKRSNSRPYEGFAAERKEAERRVAYDEQKRDRKLEAVVRRAYHELPPRQRRILEGR